MEEVLFFLCLLTVGAGMENYLEKMVAIGVFLFFGGFWGCGFFLIYLFFNARRSFQMPTSGSVPELE